VPPALAIVIAIAVASPQEISRRFLLAQSPHALNLCPDAPQATPTG